MCFTHEECFVLPPISAKKIKHHLQTRLKTFLLPQPIKKIRGKCFDTCSSIYVNISHNGSYLANMKYQNTNEKYFGICPALELASTKCDLKVFEYCC